MRSKEDHMCLGVESLAREASRVAETEVDKLKLEKAAGGLVT